jgi:hypothetical protein
MALRINNNRKGVFVNKYMMYDGDVILRVAAESIASNLSEPYHETGSDRPRRGQSLFVHPSKKIRSAPFFA